MTKLSAVEHKFLQQLYHQENHRLPFDRIRPNPKTPTAQCRSLAYQLKQQQWIDYEETILQLAITPKGRLVFELEIAIRPVTPDEWWVLKSCRYHGIAPSEISRRIPESMRRSLINALEDRNFITTQRRLGDVWLTGPGLAWLTHGESLR